MGLAATMVVLFGSSASATPYGTGGTPGPRTSGGAVVHATGGVSVHGGGPGAATVRTSPGVVAPRAPAPYSGGVRYATPPTTTRYATPRYAPTPGYGSPNRRFYYPRYYPRYRYYPYYGYGWWRPYWYYPYYPGYAYYYDYGGYYPAAAVGGVAPAYGPTTVAARREPTYSFGLGLNVSGKRIDGLPDATGIGVVGRFHSGSSLDFELELAQDKFSQSGRADTRVGAGLYLPLFGDQLQPYLVVGAGVNFIHTDGTAGISDVRQGYLAGGGGLALRFGRLSIGGDVRYNVRHLFDQNNPTVQQAQITDAAFPQNKEQGWEGRITGLLYF